MSKKHFIALADMIRDYNRPGRVPFTQLQIEALADWCKSQNAEFKRDRWIEYVNGECGPNGGVR